MVSGPYLINSSTKNVVPFNGLNVFTIGRSTDCDLDISAIYISRKQCRIENIKCVGWAIFDESRFKTTKLNNEPIGNSHTILKDGDKINFSPCSGAHEYFFHSNENPHSDRLVQLDINEIGTQCPYITTQMQVDENEINDVFGQMATQSTFSMPSPKKKNGEELEKLQKENILLEQELKKSHEHTETTNFAVSLLETTNKGLLSKVEEFEQTNKDLKEKLAAMQSTVLVNECSSSKQAVLEEKMLDLLVKTGKLDAEKMELNEAVNDAESEIERLLQERCCKILKFGLDTSIKEGKENNVDTLTEVELSLMKEDLKELTKKNTELSCNVEALSMEKDEFSSKVTEIVDSELYCTICSDLLYQAMILQCKHTFCKVCIEEWKKKKRECPVCRTKIKSQVSCLVVDNLVEKVVEAFGGEMKTRRQQLILERSQTEKVAASTRQNKRKRNTRDPLALDIQPFIDPIINHLMISGPLDLSPNQVGQFHSRGLLPAGPLFHEVVDLTSGSPSHQPFRGFERYARRRRR